MLEIHSILRIFSRIMFISPARIVLAIAIAWFPGTTVPAAMARETGDAIVFSDGSRPGSRKSNPSETLYLASALGSSIRVYAKPVATPTPRPQPTPKPKATPKPKPTPKPRPTPKSTPATQEKKPEEPRNRDFLFGLIKRKSPEVLPEIVPAVDTPRTASKKTPTPQSTPPPQITIRKESKKTPTPPPDEEFDDLDEYGDTVRVFDPIQPVNRGLFWVNHQLYAFILRPVTTVYTTVLPKPVRTAVKNVYDNIEYPIRLTNHVLQLDFKNADLETRKFLVNSVGGVGGIIRLSDRFPALADVPSNDTGQTFARWGIGHGPYFVLPVLGPRSARDTIGLAGDVALNPLTYIPFGGIGEAVSLAVSAPNTTRNMEMRLNVYDAATRDAIDPYLSLRDAYIQSRDKATKKP
jgi:phospholipid-binding lipoprotein MlaA